MLGRPNVPLQMVGGRPQPGSELRSRPATPRPAEFATPRRSLRLQPISNPTPLARPDTPLPWSPPALAPDDRPPVVFSRQIKVPRAREARIYMSPGVGFNELTKFSSRARLPGSSSGLNGRLYGQPVVVRPGQVNYQTTRQVPPYCPVHHKPFIRSICIGTDWAAIFSRMEDWLSDLGNLSLNPDGPVPLDASSSVGGEAGSSRAGDIYASFPQVNEQDELKAVRETRRGYKRAAPAAEDDYPMADFDQPLTKRARLAETFNLALKRTTTAMSRAGSRLSRGDALDMFTTRASTPFSMISRPNTRQDRRRVKICLLGDSGAGKTAFLNRLIYGTFNTTEPSVATDYRVINTWFGDTREAVNVEIWEFPGQMMASQRNVHLMSTFFHAAIICYSIENVQNLSSLAEVWKFALDVSLHDRPIFVLGLKKDVRPTFPGLGLSFLPKTEIVTPQRGCDSATMIRASGYGECSAKTGDNCAEAWEGITNFIIAKLVETEKKLSKNKDAVNRENIKNSAKETAKDASRVVNKAFSWIPKWGKKMKDMKEEKKQKRDSAASLATVAAGMSR
ncbi:P-loop containing nucleoside triphosphate hydrolase protein [Cladorrhinum sp. PSN259]|nr:P-loop containing nucleoside triphosphate hydrolase protein [Cladorrhinum sp. PSN259]